MEWSLLDLFPESFLLNILDVGAAIGEKPLYQYFIDLGRARLIGFEPNKEECDKLNQVYGEPHQFFPHFIGDGKPATFYETNWNLTGSLFEPNTPLLSKFQNLAEVTTLIDTHTVDTVCLDDIEEIGCVDFFKIDVQGNELSIFENGQSVLETVLLIQTEVEFVQLYKDQPLFSDVDAYLRSKGFQFFRFTGFGTRTFKPLVINKNPNAGSQFLWSDAVYVKDWLQLDALSDLQLMKYAALSHHLYRAFDLAYFVLAYLDGRINENFATTYIEKIST